MLQAKHRNADMRVAQIKQSRSEAVDFMPKQGADWKARLPIENINRMCTGLDCGDLVGIQSEIAQDRAHILYRFPGHPRLRSEGGLANRSLGGTRCDTAQ